MRTNQLADLDFPPRTVIYQNQNGQVWLAYNSAEYLYRAIFERHGLEYPQGDVQFYANVLEKFSDFAISEQN